MYNYSLKTPTNLNCKTSCVYSVKFCNILHSDSEYHIASIFSNVPLWKSTFVVCG